MTLQQQLLALVSEVAELDAKAPGKSWRYGDWDSNGYVYTEEETLHEAGIPEDCRVLAAGWHSRTKDALEFAARARTLLPRLAAVLKALIDNDCMSTNFHGVEYLRCVAPKADLARALEGK